MSKRLILILALAFVVGIAFAAYAEVQNVKVGGDITVYGIARNNYEVTGSGGGRSLASIGTNTEARDNYMTILRLKIDADLTDNVSTTLRLINERDWEGDSTTAAESNIDLDLAYVTLKEFLYSPLTLTVGRQDLRIGSALVIGDGVLTDRVTLLEDDLSSRKAFDAIVATLDYDPLTLVLATAKLTEAVQGGTTGYDDSDAYVLDAVYKFKNYNAVADLSYLLAYDSSGTALSTGYPTKGADTHVIDLRLTAEPIKNLSAELEYARQFGRTFQYRTNKGWALTAGANYTFADMKYSPILGLKYDYRSGERNTTAGVSGDYKGWQALYEDQVNGAIYDPNTNISIIKVSGSMKPVEDIILAADYYNYRYAVKPASSATRKGKKDAGDELDLNLTYNYTEDVSFGLLSAFFWPGSDYAAGGTNDHNATELLGSMKVTF